MFKNFFYIVNKKNIRDSQKRLNKFPFPSRGLGTRRLGTRLKRLNKFPFPSWGLGTRQPGLGNEAQNLFINFHRENDLKNRFTGSEVPENYLTNYTTPLKFHFSAVEFSESEK